METSLLNNFVRTKPKEKTIIETYRTSDASNWFHEKFVRELKGEAEWNK